MKIGNEIITIWEISQKTSRLDFFWKRLLGQRAPVSSAAHASFSNSYKTCWNNYRKTFWPASPSLNSIGRWMTRFIFTSLRIHMKIMVLKEKKHSLLPNLHANLRIIKNTKSYEIPLVWLMFFRSSKLSWMNRMRRRRWNARVRSWRPPCGTRRAWGSPLPERDSASSWRLSSARWPKFMWVWFPELFWFWVEDLLHLTSSSIHEEM